MVSLDSTPHIVPNRLVIPLPLSSRRKATSSALRVEMTSASNGAEYRCFITDANGDMGSTRVATVKLDTRDWQMEYNTSGLRTRRISDDKTYSYIYAGDKLMRMTVGDDILDFSYDANGAPLTMTYNGTVYYYITNLQGDVMSLERADGGSGASYAYDAWGNIIAMSGTLAELNPCGTADTSTTRRLGSIISIAGIMTRRWVGLLVRITLPALGKALLDTICSHIVITAQLLILMRVEIFPKQ